MIDDKSLILPDSLRVSVSICSAHEPEGGGSIPCGTERAKILARRNRPGHREGCHGTDRASRL